MPQIPIQENEFEGLLGRLREGDQAAEAILFEAIYSDLRHLAACVFSSQQASHTLQPTALANEAWLKLSGGLGKVRDRHHFFALAARAMHQILVDHARAISSQKRGGSARKHTLFVDSWESKASEVGMLELHEAIQSLAERDERSAEIAKLRLLGSLSVSEIADVLTLSERTVKRDWQVARLWLQHQLRER